MLILVISIILKYSKTETVTMVKTVGWMKYQKLHLESSGRVGAVRTYSIQHVLQLYWWLDGSSWMMIVASGYIVT